MRFVSRRFGGWVDRKYAVKRIVEDYSTRLSLPFPQDQHWSNRNERLSGAHSQTAALGAVYEEIAGRERPRFYAPADWQGREPKGWRRTASFDLVNAEAQSLHAGVGLGEFSPFAKFEISGPDARSILDRVCANRIPVKPGGTCLTTYLNERATIEGEATIACLGEDRFWFVTGGPSELRAWDWLQKNVPNGAKVRMTNRTMDTGVLTVAGPKSRATLQACTSADLSNAAFGWLKAREIEVAGIPVIALRLSFTGELAWELHAPEAKLGALWQALWEAGKPHGIAPFGSAAMNALRMEKAYRGGQELGGDTSPIGADVMQFVKMEKDFIGRPAVLARQQKGENSTLVYLEVDAVDQDCLGGEIIMAHGRKAGSVTSGAFGPITRKSLAFGFVGRDHAAPGTELHISILGELRKARVLEKPVRDPENLRLKA